MSTDLSAAYAASTSQTEATQSESRERESAATFRPNQEYERALTLETADPAAFKRLSSSLRMGLALYREQKSAAETVRLKDLAAEFKPDRTFDELLDDMSDQEREEVLSRYPGTRSLLKQYAERRSAARTLAARKN